MAVSFAGEVANVVTATPGVLLLLTCAAAGFVLVLLLRWLGDACWVHRLPLDWQIVGLLKVFSTFAGFLELLLALRAAADLPPAYEILANNGRLGQRALYFRI